MANKPYYTINEDQAKLHISQGNEKIGKGIWSFSTLPGNEEHMIETKDKGLLTDIPGTCSHLCDGCFKSCYARASLLLHHNVNVKAWGENTLLLRNGKLWDDLELFIKLMNGKAERFLRQAREDKMNPDEALKKAHELAVVKILRVDVSGEIENVEQLRRWNLLALAHPYVQFSTYTKNFEAVAAFLDGGSDFAENFVVNISQWNHCADAFLEKYSWAKLNVFEYCPNNRKDCDLPPEEIERLEKLPKCPAVTRSGHHAKTPDGRDITCTLCQNCYRKTGRHIGVWSH